jgi:hypothetical protein
MKGYMAMLLSNTAVLGAVDQRIATARRTGSAATPREHLHLAALEAWRHGRNARAIAAWEEILASHPRDLTALRLAHFAYFWSAGDAAPMRASVERVLPHWPDGVRGRGWVLGMHGFACEESGDYALAERQGRRAVEIDASDLWAVHAVAHVMEMQSRHAEGAAWVEAGRARVARYANLPPGRYRFEVHARSVDGIWSPTVSRAFSLAPDLHERPQVQVGALLLVVLLVAVGVRARLAQQVGVERAAQAPVGGNYHHQGVFYLAGCSKCRGCIAVEVRQDVRQHAVESVGVRTQLYNGILCLAQLSRRNHFHGFSDLLRRHHRLDALAYFF